MRRVELAAAAVLVLIGLATIVWLIPSYVADTGASSAVPPSFMPYVAAALLTAGALASLATALRRGASASVAAPFTKDTLKFLGASVAVVGGACWLMSAAGYIAGGTALVAGLLLIARVRPVTIAATAVLTPAALWLTFVYLLDTPLP